MKIDFAATDYGEEEIAAVNRVLRAPLLASGPENEAFEKEFAEYVGAKYAVAVNSGSSANLLALAALKLPNGSKVITSACGFPATLNPAMHLGLEPIFVDYSVKTFNVSTRQIKFHVKEADAIILAHTLGNAVDISWDSSIPLIEDCCEAVGSQDVGRRGAMATWSFYPAHQMTALGGGGMVTTNNEVFYQRMKSMRDWGKVYTWDSSLGGNKTTYTSSINYHQGYTYTNIGWNFKLPEANCAFGREQIKRLDSFREIRYRNWKYLRNHLRRLPNVMLAPMSKEASPFGFCMTVPDRNKFGDYLEKNGIKHRPFFAGNILRQPAYQSVMADKFPVADYLMKYALFIGCHTKLTQDDLDYIVRTIRAYPGFAKFQRRRYAKRINSIGAGSEGASGQVCSN